MCVCVRACVCAFACVCVRARVCVSQLMDTQLAEARKVLEKLIRKQREQVCAGNGARGLAYLCLYACSLLLLCTPAVYGVLGVNVILIIIIIMIIIIIIIITKSTFIPSRAYPFTDHACDHVQMGQKVTVEGIQYDRQLDIVLDDV